MADLTSIEELRRSPVGEFDDELRRASRPGSVRLVEWPFTTMVSVRVEAGSPAGRRIETALGVALPRTVGQTTRKGAYDVLWLGPDEWLVVSASDSSVVERLQAAASGGEGPGENAQVVDVSANRTVLELGGPRARDVLEKGCPLDLHPRAFADDSAYVTTLARVPVIVWKSDETMFRILPRASLAAYVAAWLVDAMQEFAPADHGSGAR
jgi:sarcosine oxidase subunit gamma